MFIFGRLYIETLYISRSGASLNSAQVYNKFPDIEENCQSRRTSETVAFPTLPRTDDCQYEHKSAEINFHLTKGKGKRGAVLFVCVLTQTLHVTIVVIFISDLNYFYSDFILSLTLQ
jgi:hypothetical protein